MMINDFESRGKLIFKECSEILISQFACASNLIGCAEIESFYAPYYCRCESDKEIRKLIYLKEHLEKLQKRKAPNFICEKCGETLLLNASEKGYFCFIPASQKSVFRSFRIGNIWYLCKFA